MRITPHIACYWLACVLFGALSGAAAYASGVVYTTILALACVLGVLLTVYWSRVLESSGDLPILFLEDQP